VPIVRAQELSIFDLIYLAGATPAAPYLVYKAISDGRFTDRWQERLGFVARSDAPSIWFHAASVGEVNALRSLRPYLGGQRVVLTAMTPLGRENGARTFPEARVSYAPLDWTPTIRRFISRARPKLLVLVEQELWPNMILNAPCPVAMVNARMTERSADNYRRLGGVFRRIFRRLDLVLAQNEEYARRYRELGAGRVEVAGNLKFDALPEVDEAAERAHYRAMLGEPLLVGGSTHAPEEEILVAAFDQLKGRSPDLRLALAPRHLERIEEVRRIAGDRKDVYVLDKMGELYKLYCAATAVFVGGTFCDRGGQSIIEPASLGKPIVTGPDLRNFADTAEALVGLGVLKIAEQPKKEVPLLADALAHPERGEPGRAFIRASKGCAARIAETLLRLAA
jgi:3-deoxy-D-manno-octulosonic-acid transferase